MPFRIEVSYKPGFPDPRGLAVARAIRSFLDLSVESVRTRRVYFVDAPVSPEEIQRVREEITDPILESSIVGASAAANARWVLRVGFRPGVTDNVGRTARTAVEDILGRSLPEEAAVHTAVEYLLEAPALDRADAETIGRKLLANEMIETLRIFSPREWEADGARIEIPRAGTEVEPTVETIELPDDDRTLEELSRKRLLSLTIAEMRTIRDYFTAEERIRERAALDLPAWPTDVELECLAQTWSEHCKHKIFNARIRYVDEFGHEERIDGLFPTYIRRATESIGRSVDWLVSVFHDNAGVIRFNDRLLLAYKVETHNSPSALDPYGGAITGIVGVNRDPFGTGRGFALLVNTWGYCFASPFFDGPIPNGLLHPRRIRDGVHQGVIDGGNQSGIPYGFGWERFDPRFLGKPLVFCGTVGVAPAEIRGEPTHVKTIRPGDRVVMVGGRIGKDGIHGATFSSAELTEESPVQAVQIGDPITQKKMTDFLLEARDAGLFDAITDNGAGGLSSSVGEICRLSGGVDIDLARAPLKYAGMQPWEILLSEAQERMTVSVPEDRLDEFLALARRREVEATDLGVFTDSGRFLVRYEGRVVADLDLDFLHDGLPKMELEARWIPPRHEEPDEIDGIDPGEMLQALLRRPNFAVDEDRCRRYDHEVKGLTVVKPFVGVDRDMPADATVFLVEHGETEGIVLAAGVNPFLSDLDTYAMVAACIDEAVRRAVATGADPSRIAGIDNFCWPDPLPGPDNPDAEFKLAQLVRANQALFDVTIAYGVPCISGKDSMKNDSVRGGVRISIPPTVLFSVIGKIEDVRRAVTPDVKAEGDLVYVAGTTSGEMGGSAFYRELGERTRGAPYVGERAPGLDAPGTKRLCERIAAAIRRGWIRSAHAPTLGGLAVAFARIAMGGGLGIEVDLEPIPRREPLRTHELLFAESNGRFVLTIPPPVRNAFEQAFADLPLACVGRVTETPRILLRDPEGTAIVDLDVEEIRHQWKSALGDA